MKMLLGNTPVNSLNVHHYNMDTNDCTMVASDLQAGVTAVARGQKITGTGKSFEFAYYGRTRANDSVIIPVNSVNVVHVSSIDYPTCLTIQLSEMKNLDFSTNQTIGKLIADGSEHSISVIVQNYELTVFCDIAANFEIFFGKDNYV